jgi:type I restriction enzyme S subunit
MRNGWPSRRLGDVCEIIMGQSPDGDSYNTTGEGVPLINGPVEFSNDSFGKTIRAKFTTQPTKLCRTGDLILCVRGSTTGRMNIAGFDACIGRGVAAIRAKQYQPWINHFVSSKRDEIHGKGTGATFPNVSGSTLADFDLLVPPLTEQQRIVGILDEAFEGIATARANAEKNLQNARALFESHLQSVFTQRGPGWVEKSVGDLVAEGILVKPFDGNHGEIHPRKADHTESGVPFIMAFDLQNGSVDTEHCTFISRKLADSLRVGFAKDGDVLISHKGTIGRSAIVSTEDEFIMLTPQVTSYRVKDASKLFNRFIRYYFMSPIFQREMIAAAADGSTRAYIGITKQLFLRFHFPSLAEQKRIAAELDVLDPETQRLASLYDRKHAALEELKKSLLHQAFTGKL